MGENNELKYRYLHINNLFEENEDSSVKGSVKSSVKDGIQLNETQTQIIDDLRVNPKHTMQELSELIGITKRAIEKNIKTLRENGYIERAGGRKNGHWIVKI